MSPQVMLALLAGAALGMGALALLRRVRTNGQSESASLIPHRTRQLMGAAQAGMMVVRRDRRSAYSNVVAVSLGLARPDGALHSEVADLAERAWERGEPVEDEVAVRRGVLGSVTSVHVRVAPLDDDLVLAVANDRTEQRAVEASRREFAINVSHELKTPVGALALLAETLEAVADEPDNVRLFAAKIGKESRRLAKLIQEIIEISRLQGADSVIDQKLVPIAEVVAEAAEAASVAAEARHIALTATPSPGAVLGDRDLLVMAVRNLVDNAVAYSDRGGKVAVVAAVGDGEVRVSVIDQGIGIAESEQERIFERFYRTDPARSRETGGTGLGLSIVKHIALQHAGEVSVWSKVGVGSTFTLRLPLHEEVSGS